MLAAYAYALIGIKIAGGFYLLWLAYKSFRSACSAHDIEAATLAGSRRTVFGYFSRGLIVQMTNPKAALAWIVSLGLHEHAPIWVGLALVIGTSFLSVIIHCLYAVAFSTSAMVRLYSRARRSIQAALAAFFAFAGIKLLTSRL